ncbi:MAG: OmpH family outer membrane protein [Flavobacteriaceae bacterium]|nr:OmpH family outer membrane protein [Flavobacteriaceae bacterium]
MTVKRVLIVLMIFINFVTFAQKGQRVAYIDMNYILENVPEYVEAQARLNDKVKKWQQKLDVLTNDVEMQRTDLSNEKSLLTKELITEREEDIYIKNQELKRLQIAYFGPTGDLFQLRKQLATPVQDQVYNAIQEIAKRKRYDFVLDKSSDLIILYSNSKFDISEQVLNSIVKGRKRKAVEDNKNARIKKAGVVSTTAATAKQEGTNVEEISKVTPQINKETSDINVTENEEKTDAQKKIDERNAKREALKAKIKAQQEGRVRKRDSLKKVADEKRATKLKEIEDRKKQREKEIENKD